MYTTEIERYTPTSPEVSKWFFSHTGLPNTQRRLNNLLEACDKLEAFLMQSGCSPEMFYVWTSDTDELVLTLEFSSDKADTLNETSDALLDFLLEEFPTIQINGKSLHTDKYWYSSLKTDCKCPTLSLLLRTDDIEYCFPSADYLNQNWDALD
jgi:hypothetical protein